MVEKVHLTGSLLLVAFLTSFGSSMLYGYNLAVVNSPAVYIKEFYNRTALIRNGTGFSGETLTVMYSLTVSVFAVGGLVGSLIVGMLVTRFGRKGTVVYTTVLVFIAGLLMGLSRICGSPEMIIMGRFITGIHSGISLSVVPMYLGEIAPKNLRGFLSLVPSVFIGIGVFTHTSNFFILFSSFYCLRKKKDGHVCLSALKWYRTKCNIQSEIEEMQEEQRSLSSVETLSVLKLVQDHTVRWQVLSVVVINIGMQLSGIDAIWFYTNDIFENAGIPHPEIQYTTAGTGIIEIIAGLIGCFTIEKLGRRTLIIGGFIMMGLCSAGITTRFLVLRYLSVCCVVGIIAGFCIGPAGVPFLITAELFKQSHRPAAYIIAGSLNWVSNFIVGFVFPFLQMSAGAYCYLVFATICISVAIFVYIVIPETKNKTFMEISQMFSKKESILGPQAFLHNDQLKLKKIIGYVTMTICAALNNQEKLKTSM
uniref:Solute carrier family 2, facilitated glucose transporter member 9-like n=1 Tax=Gouania willdenowi TaxID=441366 RepID=A0A8C5G756_GOUWI